MKKTTQLILGVFLVLGLAISRSVQAQTTWTWNADAGDNWTVATRWTPNVTGGPSGAGNIAALVFDITANRTVTLNASKTIGTVLFQDTTTASHDWTLGVSSGAILTLSGNPTLAVLNRTATINPVIAGTEGFVKTGGGTLQLNNFANTLTGKIILGQATTRIRSDGSLGPAPGTLTADAIIITNGATLMNYDSDVSLAATRGITLGAGGGRLQAGWGKPLAINGPITGTTGLSINNDTTPGVISLNGANTYTGATTIGNGVNNWAILLVNGSTHASSTVAVTANAWLGGDGTINGPVWATNRGVLSAGARYAPGTLTVNHNVSLTNATLAFDLANVTTVGSGVNDLLQVNGNLTLAGTITVNISPLAGALATGTYRLINYTGTLTGGAANLVLGPSRYSVTFDDSTPGQINMIVNSGAPANLTWQGTNGLNWDLATTVNWLGGAGADVFHHGDNVTFDDAGLYTSAVSIVGQSNALNTLQPGSVTVATTNNVTLTSSGGGPGGGRLGGPMNLYKGGSGVFVLTVGNGSFPHYYDGLTVVTNGTLRLGTPRVLGSTNGPTVVTNGGTLDLNAQAGIVEPVIAQGAGATNLGAIVNTGGNTVNDGLRGAVTLAGDTTFGGSGRWDVYGGALYGNGYKLTKVGANEIALSNLGDTGLGDIEIQQGTLTFLGTARPGDPASTITVVSNATLNYWALNNTVTTPVDKLVTLAGGNWRNGSGSNYHTGTITLIGTNTFNMAANGLVVLGPIEGSGTLQVTGGNTLLLAGTNTYTGATLVSAGRLKLGATGTLSNSSPILVAGGAIFDVSPLGGGFQLQNAQTLAGAGSVVGSVSDTAGATISPGGNLIGTLTITNTLTLGGGGTLVFDLSSVTNEGGAFNDLIVVTNLSLSGVTTIRVNPGGLLANAPYRIIRYSGTLTGSAANFTVQTDSRYTFVVDTTSLPGYVTIEPVGGSALPLTWVGGQPGSERVWDLQNATNWVDPFSSLQMFFAADLVTFDDSATFNTVELVGNLAPGGVTVSNATKDYGFGGTGKLTGATGLTKTGAGKLTLTNAGQNDYFGPTVIDGGTLQIGDNSTSGNLSPNSTVTNNASLVFDRADDVTVPNVINGAASGNLIKENTNALTLSGDNVNYAGAITVNVGTLKQGHANALGSAASVTTVNNDATLDFNGIDAGSHAVVAAGYGVGGAGALVNNGGTISGNNALRSLTLTNDTAVGGLTRWDMTSGGTGLAGNNYKLTKVGPNMVSLKGLGNTGLGDIEIQSGTLRIETTTTLGNPANSAVVNGGGVLSFWNLHSNWLDKPITLNAGGAINNDSGTNTINATLTLNGPAVLNCNSGFLVLTNAVTGPGSLTKNGGGELLLYNGGKDWTGGSTFNAGIVRVYDDGALAPGTVVNHGQVAFTPGAAETITYTGHFVGSGQVVQSVSALGTTILTGNVTNGVVVSSNTLQLLGNGAGPVTVNSGSLLLGSTASFAAGSVTVGVNSLNNFLAVQPGGFLSVGSGPGTDLIVGRMNTDSRPTDGVLDVSSMDTFSANVSNVRIGYSTANSAACRGSLLLATNNVLNAATSIQVGFSDPAGDQAAVQSFIELGAGTNLFNTPLLHLGARKILGAISNHAGGTLILTNSSGAGTDLYLARHDINTGTFPVGTLDASGGPFIAHLNNLIAGMKFNGGNGGATGHLILGNHPANNVNVTNVVLGDLTGGAVSGCTGTGSLTMSNGLFQVRSNVALANFGTGSGTAVGTLNLYGGTFNVFGDILGDTDAASTSTVLLDGALLDLQPTGDAAAGVIGTTTQPIKNLSLLSGTLRNVGEINGGATVTKSGPGTLVIEGVNTYSGTTEVADGTLLVNGSLGAGGLNVSGGTLGGTGTIGGNVTVQTGGTLAPATSIGTLTINGALNLAGACVIEIDRAGTPTADRVTGVTSLTYGGTLTVQNLGAAPVAGDSFDLFDAASFSGAFTATNLPALDPGLNWYLGGLLVDGTIVVNRTPLASNLVASTTENTPITIPGAKFLARCGDPDGNPLTLLSVSNSTNGALVTLIGGDVTYTPNPGFVGADRFTYTVADNRSGSASAEVEVLVYPGNVPGLNIISVQNLGGNNQFTFAGIPGRTYGIERALEVTGPWTNIASVLAAPNGRTTFTDSNSPPGQAFYRTTYP